MSFGCWRLRRSANQSVPQSGSVVFVRQLGFGRVFLWIVKSLEFHAVLLPLPSFKEINTNISFIQLDISFDLLGAGSVLKELKDHDSRAPMGPYRANLDGTRPSSVEGGQELELSSWQHFCQMMDLR